MYLMIHGKYSWASMFRSVTFTGTETERSEVKVLCGEIENKTTTDLDNSPHICSPQSDSGAAKWNTSCSHLTLTDSCFNPLSCVDPLC